MKKVELLAPAGSYESFLGAIHAGADAVYLGGSKFGARAYANNFQTDELCGAIRYAHLFGRKVYLTLNTLIKEKEFAELYDYILPFYESGLDGVIVQDLGVFLFLKNHFPGLQLHISTQMTITGKYGACFLKESGAVRVVPARELSLQEIKEMKEQTGIEIETFIHGSMCYCYSGQCLFSSILGGRSGNRGRCAQPCRLPYEVLNGGKTASGSAYPLSLKDMCTIQFIPQLIEAGIDSFKIEGRMKKSEYAAGVTSLYRKYIDKYYRNPKAPYEVSEEDMKKLESLYIRSEIHEGYYNKHNGSNMITNDSPGYRGSDETLFASIRETYLETALKRPISIYAAFYEGAEAAVTFSCGDIHSTVVGQMVQGALKQPVTKENVEEQLRKLGNTIFSVEDIYVDVQEGIFYPLKEINELRRRAVAELEAQILLVNAGDTMNRAAIPPKETPVIHSRETASYNPKQEHDAEFHVLVSGKQQLEEVLESKLAPTKIYLDADMVNQRSEWISLLKELRQNLENKGKKIKIYVAMPHIIRDRDKFFLERMLPVLQEADGCLFRNLETYGYLKENRYGKEVCSDAGVYIWNTHSLEFWKDKVESFCLPYELNRKEQSPIVQGHLSCEQVVYGYLPMMVTANCVAKTTGGCGGDCTLSKENYMLKDRYQKKFPVYTNCKHCYNIIYNTVPLSLHTKVGEKKSAVDYRLDFTMETGKETREVLEFFYKASLGREQEPPYQEYTTGHEKRGVE